MKKILLIFLVALAFAACAKEEHVETANIVMTMDKVYSSLNFKLSGSGTAVIDWGDGSANDTLELQIDADLIHHYNSESSYTVRVYCENIKSLHTLDPNLKTLDVSRTASLENLQCWSQKITSLDLRKNTALTNLNIYGDLTSIDLSKNTALRRLAVYPVQQLTSIDLSKNTALEYLYCRAPQLKSLDLSANNKLVGLHLEAPLFSADELNTLFKSLPFYVYDQSHALLYDRPGEIYISNTPGTDSCDISIAEKKGWDVVIF